MENPHFSWEIMGKLHYFYDNVTNSYVSMFTRG